MFGQVRVATPLAKVLAESLFPTLEAGTHEAARKVARLLADSASSPVRLRVGRGPRKVGKVEVRLDGGSKVRPVASACRDCGVILDHSDRQICDECLPHHDQARTAKLSKAGKAALAAMRASPDDPARSPEATAKKREKSRSTSLAMRAWEREHGRADPALYEKEIMPRIQRMTVPQLMKLTRLSQFHCWKVRKGERRLHARHWDAIANAAPGAASGSP